ncbi:hypothetical protein FDT66_12950 [Polaribacter aestuariivivens]|uniref:Uncharacterized protein n=1 Tax=Polaribacter aestuariivivens TaxID=2304626 RepID=A0A5S3N5Z3_9FLAO|nr:hypothetical protein [Polaribacter aestuariivivens]TMM28809.1 hypothetical protein FDT66_12950 [Polaribacter aestuariivivens]
MEYLSYIFIFYVGFYFFRLAENHQKNKWLYGFLGIITYYSSSIIFMLFLKIFHEEEIGDFDFVSITMKSFLIGLLSIFFLFQSLSFIWGRKKKNKEKEINKIGKE